MAIAGIQNRYWIAAAVLVLAVIVVVALARRRRAPKLDVNPLQEPDAQRYRDEFATIERDFVDRPDQAVARARGMVDEVMRRMGFPDRIDAAQKAKDLAGYDREGGKLLVEAEEALHDKGEDTERMRVILQRYRSVMFRLLGEGSA